MAKSARSKKEKRLKAIRRELVQPFYDKKDEAKLTALQAALAAPKLLVKSSPFDSISEMDAATTSAVPVSSNPDMDMEIGDGNQTKNSLKPIGKKLKKKLKIARRKNSKGRTKRRHI